MKLCSRCGKEKPRSEYYKRTGNVDGLFGHCKTCHRLRTEVYDKTPERRTIRAAEARAKNKTPHGKYRMYKDAATTRGIPFKVTEEQFLDLWQKPCYYCGVNISTIGVDRVDNTRGYELDNIQPCCTSCNKMKLDSSEKEFYNKLFRIIKHRNLKENTV